MAEIAENITNTNTNLYTNNLNSLSTKLNIMLLEDSKLDTLLFLRVMEINGYLKESFEFNSIKGAIKHLNKGLNGEVILPDLIVLDYFINEQKVDEVIEFTNNNNLQNIDIAVITASKMLIDEEYLFRFPNVLGVLDKPFKILELKKLMQKNKHW